MKLVRVAGTALLFLSLAAPGAFAQQQGRGQSDKHKRNAQQAKGKEPSQSGRRAAGARPQPPPSGQRGRGQEQASQAAAGQQGQGGRAQHAVPRPTVPGPGHAGMPYSHPLRSEQQVRDWQLRRGWVGRGSWQAHATWEQHRAERWRLEHRTWTQRGGYGGFFVPIERFRLFFGVPHLFRLYTRPIIVEGYPRFWYGGYWWMIVDPWPEFWAANWYDTDDLYIDYSDGYYLYDRRHPGVGLAISVVF
jgi:hypothetical protein